jgi:mannose-1-phosphate guanylyltransferase/mannose-6-phosphate isomerase
MGDVTENVFAVLLAGGTGTRLWPVSRERFPKQLVKFIGEDSLVQSTVKRLLPPLDPDRVRVVCGQQHLHEIGRHLSDIGIDPAGKVITEPSGRNTAPAILLAAMHIRRLVQDAILCVFPADHVIGDVGTFHAKLGSAIQLAARGYIVTFGIQPGYPETGYGYVEGGSEVGQGALRIKRFVEKPDYDTACEYVRAGNFFWNSGMFTFRLPVLLDEFERYQSGMLTTMEAITAAAEPMSAAAYNRLPELSIDYAVMERTTKGAVLPSDFGWSDIGSWKSLYDFLPKDSRGNVIDGDVVARDTQSCFILGRERLIATNHLKELVIVDTPDSLFVSDLENSRDVKGIVAELKQRGRREYHQHRTAYFQWGTRTLLDRGGGHAIAKMTIYPAEQMPVSSSDGMRRRFVVLDGQGEWGDDRDHQTLAPGETIELSPTQRGRIENTGPAELVLLQIQTAPNAR